MDRASRPACATGAGFDAYAQTRSSPPVIQDLRIIACPRESLQKLGRNMDHNRLPGLYRKGSNSPPVMFWNNTKLHEIVLIRTSFGVAEGSARESKLSPSFA